jgi:hypothetical protein
MVTRPWCQGALSLQLPSKKFMITERGAKELTPPVGSQPLPRWAWGPLLVLCRSGTPKYNLQVKARSGAYTHVPPRVMQLRILPLSQGGLWSCHVSSGSGTRLPTKEGSGVTTSTVAPNPLGGLRSTVCLMAPDPASLRGGLWATTCPTTLRGPQASSIKKNLASLPV